MEVSLGQPLPLRQDYDASSLRRLARQSAESSQTKRLLALAVIYDGGRRSEAAQVGGVDGQIVRDWVLRFNDLFDAHTKAREGVVVFFFFFCEFAFPWFFVRPVEAVVIFLIALIAAVTVRVFGQGRPPPAYGGISRGQVLEQKARRIQCVLLPL